MNPSSILLAALLFLSGCSSFSSNGRVLSFARDSNSKPSIDVRLQWSPAAEPPLYTPRGPMREITISEGGRSVSVPVEHIVGVEDIWPERVQLHSPRCGDYDLHLPYGVGEGSLALVRFRDFRFSEVRDIPTAEAVR